MSAIKNMHVRGAGCIGVTAAYGMCLAANQSNGDFTKFESLAQKIKGLDRLPLIFPETH